MAEIFLLLGMVGVRLGGLALLATEFVVGFVGFMVVTKRPAGLLLKPGGAPLWYQIVVPADNRRVGNAKHVGHSLDRAVVVDCLGLFHVFRSRLFFDIRNVAFPTFRVNKTYRLFM